MHVLVLYSGEAASPELIEALSPHHDVKAVAISDNRTIDPSAVLICVVDANLSAEEALSSTRYRLAELGQHIPRIFVLDAINSRSFGITQRLGAADYIYKPFDHARIRDVLAIHFDRVVESSWRHLSPIQNSAIRVSLKAFENINKRAKNNDQVEPAIIFDSVNCIISALDETDLNSWINALRDHHRYTFRHVMFVAGTLATMCKLLGFNAQDCKTVVSVGLLHDIGKARIPVEILDKPGALDKMEWEVMRQHPRIGGQLLERAGWGPHILDGVLHHHERIDGSGYPDGLHGRQIGDVVRLVTIADVYSALIDKRSYKPAMSGRAAFEFMLTLTGQLDRTLVQKFEPMATSLR